MNRLHYNLELPDARDGLTREERVALYVLSTLTAGDRGAAVVTTDTPRLPGALAAPVVAILLAIR